MRPARVRVREGAQSKVPMDDVCLAGMAVGTCSVQSVTSSEGGGGGRNGNAVSGVP